MQNAAGAFLEEAEHETGSLYEATVWQKLEDGTRKAHARALYKFLWYSKVRSFPSPREVLKGRMLHVARDGRYELLVKALLFGLRLAEKKSIIPAIVVPAGRYVGRMGIASCMETGPQSSGGRHGYQRSSGNWQPRHGRMATFRDRLDRPPEKGEGPNLQDRQGWSRRQWAHSCRMGKDAELGEELDMDLFRVHNAVCDQVQAKERSRVSEAVSQLLGVLRCGRRLCNGDYPGGCELFERVGRERH